VTRLRRPSTAPLPAHDMALLRCADHATEIPVSPARSAQTTDTVTRSPYRHRHCGKIAPQTPTLWQDRPTDTDCGKITPQTPTLWQDRDVKQEFCQLIHFASKSTHCALRRRRLRIITWELRMRACCAGSYLVCEALPSVVRSAAASFVKLSRPWCDRI